MFDVTKLPSIAVNALLVSAHKKSLLRKLRICAKESVYINTPDCSFKQTVTCLIDCQFKKEVLCIIGFYTAPSFGEDQNICCVVFPLLSVGFKFAYIFFKL